MKDVFVYGTLKTKGFVESMLGHPVEYITDATLEGYARGEHGYYVIYPEEGGVVDGWILLNMNDRDMDRLDYYENVRNGMYKRVSVQVSAQHQTHNVEAYVMGDRL